MLRLTISCDDVHPQKGWRILGDKTEKWFRQLNDEFGIVYDLFVPSCYHQKWPISQHRSWINELNNIDWISLNAHGHFHQTNNPKLYGECEFFELQETETVLERLRMMFNEWNEVGILPTGFRPPGWLMSDSTLSLVSMQCDYAALHYEHNSGQKPGRTDFKIFYGHDGIQQENISIHNGDMIMFQSHIAGRHNHNVWNEQNYEQLRLSLTHLFENYQIEPKLLKEMI